MNVLVSHTDGGSADGLASHAEMLLRRVLDRSCLSIDLIEVKLTTSAGDGGRNKYRCILKAKLLTDASVQASASDGEAILAVYRAADRVKFLLEQHLKNAKVR